MLGTASSCNGRGTHNPVLGRCTCLIGWAGPRCESFALPSCRLTTASPAATCVVRRPQHCQCLNECGALGAFTPHFNPFCFERPSDTAISAVPLFDDRSVVYREWQSRRAVEAKEALAVEFMPHMRHVPHGLCKDNCSGHGACIADKNNPSFPPWCKCDSYYAGRTCERSNTPYCWNDCLGRGTCVDGFCVCRPPYFGPGCAYEPTQLSASRSVGGLERGDRAHDHAVTPFRIHVYDLDPIVLRR